MRQQSLFFYVSNIFYWRKTKYTKRILGERIQFQKQQESKNSSKVEKWNNPVMEIQSNKVCKNNSFNSATFCIYIYSFPFNFFLHEGGKRKDFIDLLSFWYLWYESSDHIDTNFWSKILSPLIFKIIFQFL